MEVSGIRITGQDENAELMAAIRDFVARHLDLLMFLSLPLRAVLLRTFFRRSGRNLAECLVLVLYVAGFGYLLGMLSAPLMLLGQTWTVLARSVLTFVWSYWAALGFFRRGALATLWRMATVAFLHTIGTFVIFGLVAVPWVVLTR